MNKRMLLIIMTFNSISLQAADQTLAQQMWNDLYNDIMIEKEDSDNERKQLLSNIITKMDKVSELAKSPTESLSTLAREIMKGFVQNASPYFLNSTNHDKTWPTQQDLTYLETYTEQILGLKKTADKLHETSAESAERNKQHEKIMKVIAISGITCFAIKTAQDKGLCSIQ